MFSLVSMLWDNLAGWSVYYLVHFVIVIVCRKVSLSLNFSWLELIKIRAQATKSTSIKIDILIIALKVIEAIQVCGSPVVYRFGLSTLQELVAHWVDGRLVVETFLDVLVKIWVLKHFFIKFKQKLFSLFNLIT